MAIIKNGANGSVSGKVGSVVYVLTKNGNYVRSLPQKKKKRKLTEKEQDTRTHFKLVRETVSQLLPFIRMGFAAYNPPKRAYDCAMSYNLKEATIKTETGYEINWEKFMISKGLPNPLTSYTLNIDAENMLLTLQWEFDNDIRKQYSLGGYNCHLVLYSPDKNVHNPIYNNDLSYPLSQGRQEIILYKSNKTVAYHVYVFFFAFDSSNKSTDSMYLGTVEW